MQPVSSQVFKEISVVLSSAYKKKWEYIIYLYNLLQSYYSFYVDWSSCNACTYSSFTSKHFYFSLDFYLYWIIKHIQKFFSSKHLSTYML
jgi:hypothetical protein